MMWLIVALLVLAILLLAFIAFRIDYGISAIQRSIIESTHAGLNASQRQTAELECIARHTERAARPFYDSDADRRLHPERYDSNL